MKRIIVYALLCLSAVATYAQKEELIRFADFEQWLKRDIKESAIIGGATKTIYEIAPNGHWTKAAGKQNVAYKNQGGSPWATSNVYARVSGVTKAQVSVFMDKHGTGSCAKLETSVANVKVLGMINISVLASGSIFTGEMIEPVTDTDNPMSKMNLGMPFVRRPKAIRFDYMVKLTDAPNRMRQTGFSKVTTVPGKDMPEMVVILQQRREDSEGNITAKRVGTIVRGFGSSTDGWIEGGTFDIHYGNITDKSYYDKSMALRSGETAFYARNTKGNLVPVEETGWADADAVPTHAIVKFDSSSGGAYVGSVGTTIWLDNIKWVYE